MEQARLAIAGLAGCMRGPSIRPTRSLLDVFPNLDSPAAREVFLPVFELAWPVYLEHAGVPVPPSVAEFAERFTDYAAQASMCCGNRRMLLHGDIRRQPVLLR